MRARRFFSGMAVAALAAGMLGGTAGADSAVTIGSATRDGATATVTGTASFADASVAQTVGGTLTNGFAAPEASDTLGIALKSATITALPDAAGLEFTWVLGSLPAQVPPEGIRYTWSFAIDGRQYQLQAKRSNLVSITTAEDPVGHAQQAGRDFFQLRGACEASYQGTPVSGCYHLAFLQGAFDTAAGTVSMQVPFDTRDKIGRRVAPDFVPGAALVASETATMSITAAAQAFVSNTSVSNYLNGWQTYHAGPKVELGVGRPDGRNVAYTSVAELAADGSFSGTVTGLTATLDTVYARACNGVVCSVTSAKPGA